MPGIIIRKDTTLLDKLLRRSPENMLNIVTDEANDIHDDIDAHWSGYYPPASRPGDPPAIRTKELMESGAVYVMSKGDKPAVRLGYAAAHAEPLELGTYKMAARPFLRPAIERAKKPFINRIKREFVP